MRNRIVGYMLEGDDPKPVYSNDYRACKRFAEWMREPGNLEVECTGVRPGLCVVTSFLGLNQAHYPQKDLVLWETRVIRNGMPGKPYNYASARDAVTGHWEVVLTVYRQERIPIPPDICKQLAQHVPPAYQDD